MKMVDKIIEKAPKVRMYSIYDEKTGLFESPFLAQNDATSMRVFARAMVQVPTMSAFPTDFKLYYVGLFDEESGKMENVAVTQLIMSGLQCKDYIDKETAKHEQNTQTQVGDETPIQPSAEGTNPT